MLRRNFLNIFKNFVFLAVLFPYRGYAAQVKRELREEMFVNFVKELVDSDDLNSELVDQTLKSLDQDYSVIAMNDLMRSFKLQSQTTNTRTVIKTLYKVQKTRKICESILKYFYADLTLMKACTKKERINAYLNSNIWPATHLNPRAVPQHPESWVKKGEHVSPPKERTNTQDGV